MTVPRRPDAAWAVFACLLIWTRVPSVWMLAAAGAALGWAAVEAATRRGGWRRGAAVIALGLGIAAGFRADMTIRRLEGDWTGYWAGRQAVVAEAVEREFDALVAAGNRAAERVARMPLPGAAEPGGRDSLRAVLEESGMTAAAVFGADGRLRLWEGSHHGAVPPEVALGASRYAYSGTPLFSHLYFTAHLPDARGVAVAAVLMDSGLPAPFMVGLGDFASRFADEQGERIRIDHSSRAAGEGVLDLGWPDETLLSIEIIEPERDARQAVERVGWLRKVAGLMAIAWLLLAFGRTGAGGVAPAVALAAVGLLLPAEVVAGAGAGGEAAAAGALAAAGRAAAMGWTGLEGLTLGRALLAGACAAPASVLLAPRLRPQVRRWLLPLAVGAGFPLAIQLLLGDAPRELVGGPEGIWIASVLAVMLLLTVGTTFLLSAGGAASPGGSNSPSSSNSPGREADPGARGSPDRRGAGARLVDELVGASGGAGPAVAGLAAAGVLALALAGAARGEPALSPAWAALWALPAVLVARGAIPGGRISYLRFFCALWLAATAVLPLGWAERTEARMALAEERLGRLGTGDDDEVAGILTRFGDEVADLDRSGAGAVELLYHAWVASGLAASGNPSFVTLWSADGVPQEELRLGAEGDLPAVVADLVPGVQESGERERRLLDAAGVRHLAAVPLADGRVVTAAVPPRRTIAPAGGQVPLLSAVEGAGREFLTLARLADPAGGGATPPGDDARTAAPPAGPPLLPEVEWSRNDEGWMARALAAFPDGPYSVSYTISTPNFTVMMARAVLVAALALAACSVLWLGALWIVGFRLSVPIDWPGLLLSFRARVTWTLFAFFILANVVFGTLAFRALSGAAERTATALAERVVAQIAASYGEEGGSMESLARRVGADLLEYRDGELVGGSVDELIELGLYESWVDPDIYRALETGATLDASKVASLGAWQYVLAHRRLPDGDIVASPVPLRAGAAALRRRDVTDLLGMAIVLGPILALGLALTVGRALTRPIRRLRVASDRVGRGNLAVHLPEARKDEFGTVFAAFNRMVLRLDDARRELLRTTRRTQAIVEEVPLGVIAVDVQGRVTVANHTAEALLKAPLEAGEPVGTGESRAGELAGWLEECRRGGGPSADGSFRWGERRVRARARRIAQEGEAGGVVVSLEDVTDELRSERILAWGEMAKQVAHEVKNPLTPIKLSVQHLRRAWGDRRSDFGRILRRNVASILTEIERLAGIARSFSRLAAPAAGEAGPLSRVDVAGVAGEIMDLYGGGRGSPVALEAHLPEGLPAASCRPDELKQVLLNLLENARAAMPAGGVAAIRGDVSEDGVTVSVEDEGAGIPEELLPRIFEPRFSTRSGGAGLGLAIVKRLVDSWEGAVDVESRAGHGTTVRIRLKPWKEDA